MMNKKNVVFIGLTMFAGAVSAADVLHGTKWKTIDDKTKKPISIVQFSESANGTLTAKILEVIAPGESEKCSKCEGKYYNKSLKGLKILTNLKRTAPNTYEYGRVLDPQDGHTYKFKAQLSADGKTLSGRGYIGVPAIGRSQTWVRTQ